MNSHQQSRPPAPPINQAYVSNQQQARRPDQTVVHTRQLEPQRGQHSPALPQRPPKPARFSKNEIAQREQIEKDGEGLTFSKDDIIIAVMGVTGAGKSTFISLLSNEEIKIGHGLQSCTSSVGVYWFMLQGVRIWLIDTPGFDDTNRSDSEVLKDVAFWLAAAYSKETRLAGILYLQRITEVRMLGSALRNLRMFRQLCGPNNLDSVILATTHWTDKEGKSIPETVGQQRIDELVSTEEFWGSMVSRGSRVERHDGTPESARRIVSNLVDRRIRVVLDIQRQMIDQNRSLNDTDAGQALQWELVEERKKSEAALAELKLDMDDALEQKDVKWQKEIEKNRAKFEADINKTFAETAELKTNMKKMAEEKAAELRAMETKMEEERKHFNAQLKLSNGAIEAFKADQQVKEAKYKREREESDARQKRQADEYQRKLKAENERIRNETDRARRAEMAAEKEALEARYERDRAQFQSDADERRSDWEMQQRAYASREAELQQQREADQARIDALDLQARKSKDFFYHAVTAVCGVLSGAIKLGLAFGGVGVGF